METDRRLVLELLHRLLSERGQEVARQFAMLLEKHSSLRESDVYYRDVLPPQVAEAEISGEFYDKIIAILCEEVSRDPAEAFISAISFTGSEQAVKTIASVVANPPRAMTLGEYTYAFSVLAKFLPSLISANPNILSDHDFARLIEVARHFLRIDADADDIPWRIEIRHHVSQLLAQFKDTEFSSRQGS
jgi:hypothetical protein